MPPSKIVKKKATTKRKLVTAILDLQSHTHKLSLSQLQASIANLTTMIQGEQYDLPTLAISSLNLGDVTEMLKLRFSPDNTQFRNQPGIDLSPVCAQWMDMTKNAFGNSEANEALTRVTLNNLLVDAHHHVRSHYDNVKGLHLNAEALWRYGPVVYKDAKYDLVGRPDYSVWYGTKEEIAVSVVVVEAKSGGTATAGVPQTLGYMGCVHRRRKDLEKVDSTVYGVVADGQYFVFLKIDNDSQWSEYIVSAHVSNYQEVVGLLVYIFHAAALMSPVQSEKTSVQTHSKESSDVSYMGFDVEEEDSDEEEV